MRIPSLLTRMMTVTAITCLSVLSCKKETSDSNELTPQEEESVAMMSSESEAAAESAYDDVFNSVIGVNTEVGMGGVGIFGQSASNGSQETARTDSNNRCFTVTITRLNLPEPFPLRVVIDFGAGCVGPDGRLRSGKIITEYTGRLVVPGKSATTSFDNYKVDSISVAGTHKVTNTSTSNILQFTIDITNGKLTRPNGNYVEWNSHKVKTQFEGLGTPFFPLDDQYRIEGHASGKVKHGSYVALWKSEIIEPLIRKFTCRWIVKGAIKVRRETLSSTSPWVSTLEYGNGTCDNKATLIINGVSHQITLH
ncbi:MAG TPA: hypothetical protein VGB56_07830 [Flavisolibacter sp.]